MKKVKTAPDKKEYRITVARFRDRNCSIRFIDKPAATASDYMTITEVMDLLWELGMDALCMKVD